MEHTAESGGQKVQKSTGTFPGTGGLIGMEHTAESGFQKVQKSTRTFQVLQD
jgi:hypothetical protein